MKFIKVIKANNYTYISDKAKKELQDLELRLKQQESMATSNPEDSDIIDELKDKLNNLKLYLDHKNELLNNLSLDNLAFYIFNTESKYPFVKQYIGNGKLETEEEVKQQIKQALQKVMK